MHRRCGPHDPDHQAAGRVPSAPRNAAITRRVTEAANSGRQLREAEGARIGQLLEGQTRFDASSSSATCRAGSAGSVAVPRSD